MLDIDAGRRAGIATAKRNLPRYAKAETRFRDLLLRYRSDIPYALIVAHLIKVNPKLSTNPDPKGNRKGFLYTRIEIARFASLDWNRMHQPEACAYAWCLDLNRCARILYTNNKSLFPTPSVDFWKCVYLQYSLGPTAFNIVWNAASPRASEGEVYPQLVYAVNSLNRSLPGWPAGKLQREVLVGMEEVFYTWRVKGTGVIDGYGRPPVTSGTESFNNLFFGV